MYYIPSQVSQMLGVPESTLRRWASMFSLNLSDQKGRKKRLYTDQDIETFRQIKDLSSHNFTLEEITSRLSVVGNTDTDLKSSSLALIPSIAAKFEQLDRQAATIDRLAAQVEQLAAQLEDIQTQNKRPWYKRLFGWK